MSADPKERGAALLRLLPHRPPFLLLDKAEAQGSTACGSWLVPQAHPLVNAEGWLEPLALAEIMAQCFAALGALDSADSAHNADGSHDHMGPPPATGYLAALRDMRFFGQARAGDVLEVRVQVTASLGGISVVEGQVHCAGQMLAQGQCKVFVAQGAV